MTVDELAARAGMTVRNVRAYASRGLLPVPRLVGRTGYYGPEHLARLLLVREMLAEGWTLAAVERAFSGAPASGGAAVLALHRALLAPWLPEEPQVVDVDELAARTGVPVDADVLGRLADLGVLEPMDERRVRVLDPALLATGLQVVDLGVPAAALVEAQQRVTEHVEAAATAYVDMFRRTVWREFTDAGAPPADWQRIQGTVERLQPLAAQAVLSAFRTAMATAVAEGLEEEAGALQQARSQAAGRTPERDTA
jgi:DNA-binding transcriptional MerR regulator